MSLLEEDNSSSNYLLRMSLKRGKGLFTNRADWATWISKAIRTEKGLDTSTHYLEQVDATDSETFQTNNDKNAEIHNKLT